MREFGSVSPQFWIGQTGKRLRGNMEAQLLALYLQTSPHANMLGIYHAPKMYMAHETGLPLEGVEKGLRSLIEVDFCAYDDESETVFVKRMAAYQVGENLKPEDNKVKGVHREWSKIVVEKFKIEFAKLYCEDFHFNVEKTEGVEIPNEAPSKPLQRGDEPPSKQLTVSGTGALSGISRSSIPDGIDPDPSPPRSRKPSIPDCPYQKILALHNALCPAVKGASELMPKRKKIIRDRWEYVFKTKRSDGSPRATDEASGLAWFADFYRVAQQNDFIMGRTGRGPGHENWKPDIEYMLSEKGFTQVLEKTEVAA